MRNGFLIGTCSWLHHSVQLYHKTSHYSYSQLKLKLSYMYTGLLALYILYILYFGIRIWDLPIHGSSLYMNFFLMRPAILPRRPWIGDTNSLDLCYNLNMGKRGKWRRKYNFSIVWKSKPPKDNLYNYIYIRKTNQCRVLGDMTCRVYWSGVSSYQSSCCKSCFYRSQAIF